jgi:hypothetical protein
VTRLPDHVILIMTEGQWDTAAFMSDHPDLAAQVVSEAESRKAAGSAVHVLRVPLDQAAEIDAVPEQTIPPSLQDRA